MGREKLNKPPKQSKEEKEMQNKFNKEIEQLNELCKEFAEKLSDEGLMMQVLGGAGQALNHKINDLLFATEEFQTWQKQKIKIDIMALKDFTKAE